MQPDPLIFKNYFWNVDHLIGWKLIFSSLSAIQWNKRKRWGMTEMEMRRGRVSYYNNVIPAASAGDDILLENRGSETFEIYCS
jgi:hypothetical protein